MTLRFIHTGDWHLAKTFGRFDAETALFLRKARAGIVDRVAALARKVEAEAVLVAGDVFDGPLVGDAVLRKLATQLAQHDDLVWHFLPGNHDPAAANGIWQRFEVFVTGAHIVTHHEAGLWHLGDGVDLLAAPLRARAIAHDPTAWMVERQSAEGAIRVGLAHGSVQGFGSANEASVRIAHDRAVSAKLDYLALGDWHGVRQAGPKAWYAGTPEPDRFPDNEPGYALSVSIEAAGDEPEVKRHWLGEYRWHRAVVRDDLLAELDALERQLMRGSDSEAAQMLLQLRFEGRVSVDDEIALRDRVERLKDLTFHTEANFSKLTSDARATDVTALGDPLLAAVGKRLADKLLIGGDEGAAAHEALLLLAGFARDVGVRTDQKFESEPWDRDGGTIEDAA